MAKWVYRYDNGQYWLYGSGVPVEQSLATIFRGDEPPTWCRIQEPGTWVDIDTTYESAAGAVATLVREKNAAYGDSFHQSGKVLELLYPKGVQPHQYRDFLTVTRVIDKLFRIAARKDAFGESPWKDINGYSLLAMVADDRSAQ